MRILGKSKGYVGEMSRTAQLLGTLERHGIKTSYYPKEEDRETAKALPVQHAI